MNIRFPKDVISRCEKYDFHDDGNNFKGYMYKNTLPITYLRYHDEVFCSIRLDYLIPYSDRYSSEIGSVEGLCDKYNGVRIDKFNMADFVAICETTLNAFNNYHKPDAIIARNKKKIEDINARIMELEKLKLEYQQKIQDVYENMDCTQSYFSYIKNKG